MRARQRDEGAYAILYAVVVVVLLAAAAQVVDVASVRQDRRLNRSTADSAAIGGAELLDPTQITGAQPYQACLRAWGYIAATLRITQPSQACSNFDPATHPNLADTVTYCQANPPTEVIDPRTVGQLTIKIAWPVANANANGFLTPDIAPGDLTGVQPQNTSTSPQPINTDGYANGCDKLGVAIFQNQRFGIGAALGVGSGTTTQVHSVARVLPQQGSPEYVAALNVLNTTSCDSLDAKGGGNGGQIIVGPALDRNDNPKGPGIIAVESAATTACNGGNTVITASNNNLICASAASATSCDGLGTILSHALDLGQDQCLGGSEPAYNCAAISANLQPRPTAEGGTHGWVPVTKYYGCATLSNCSAPTPNYMQQLVTAYGGNGAPTTIYNGQSPYVNPYITNFATPVADVNGNPINVCPGGAGITTTITIPPGNWYVPCTLNIQSAGTVIFQGGTVVVRDAVTNAGCLVVNTAVTSCPNSASGAGATVTTPVPPVTDAILYIRGSSCPNNACFNVSGRLVMPQTFVYLGGTSPFLYSGTGFSLWTPPGGGTRDGNSRSTLDNACYDGVNGVVVDACVNSRFQKISLWQEGVFTAQTANSFTGQASLKLVGVFFTPRAYFKLAGGQSLPAVATQFWADQVSITGSGSLPLSPYTDFSLQIVGPKSILIR